MKKYGFDIAPYMNDLNKYPNIRYDYRKLVAEYILDNFYIPFTKEAHKLNVYSRVQCHGSPTDLLQCYSSVEHT